MYCVSYDGFTYQTNDPVFAHTIPNGDSEPYPRDLAIVRRYRRIYPSRGRRYVDVGAHIGTTIAPYSRMYETCVGFEANPEMVELLRTNLDQNKISCQVEPVALSDCPSRGNVRQHGANSGCFFVEEHPAGSVECRPLDSYGFTDVDFLKIDVEGAELAVLKGAEQTIRASKPLIQVECNGMSDRLFGVSQEQIVAYLQSLGYALYASAGANLFFYSPQSEPYQVICFWGSTPMSSTRAASLDALPQSTGCHVLCLTPETFADIAVPAHPIHPAFPYLSDVHKSDYVRTYMMHHYGGGYTDIKRQTGSWRPAFDALLTSDALLVGYPEVSPDGVAYPPVMHAWDSLVGNGAYICKPRTELTTEWFTAMEALLTERLDALRQSPACHPRAQRGDGTPYPLEWNEMLGRIFHRVCFAYRDRILRCLPTLCFTEYQ
jgi:FkbM family methyltransferase